MLVDVQRMLVHAHQAEESVVKFGDGTAGPMAESLSGFELVEIAAVAHSDLRAAGSSANQFINGRVRISGFAENGSAVFTQGRRRPGGSSWGEGKRDRQTRNDARGFAAES